MKVLVYGTGFAGEGHIDAFRAAGTDVIGIVGRTPVVVRKVAVKKGISIRLLIGGMLWQFANRILFQ